MKNAKSDGKMDQSLGKAPIEQIGTGRSPKVSSCTKCSKKNVEAGGMI